MLQGPAMPSIQILIIDMMLKQNPDTKKVGLLYSLSEPNSATPVAEAREYLDSKGVGYVEATGNTNDEVIAAAAFWFLKEWMRSSRPLTIL